MAVKAMTEAFSLAWRYPDEHADLLVETLARINGVNRDQILLGDGSGEILKVCADAFTGPIANAKNGPVALAPPTRGGASRGSDPSTTGAAADHPQGEMADRAGNRWRRGAGRRPGLRNSKA